MCEQKSNESRECMKVEYNILSTLTPIPPDIPLPLPVQAPLPPQFYDLPGLKPFIITIIPLRNVLGVGNALVPFGGRGRRQQEKLKGRFRPPPRADEDAREAGWVEEVTGAY